MARPMMLLTDLRLIRLAVHPEAVMGIALLGFPGLEVAEGVLLGLHSLLRSNYLGTLLICPPVSSRLPKRAICR